MTLVTDFGISVGATSRTVDAAQCMSLMNRKKIKQGQMFQLRSIQTSGIGVISLKVASAGWPTLNGWKNARKAWAEHRKDLGLKAGRYTDFKVGLNVDHFTDGTAHGGAGKDFLNNRIPNDTVYQGVSGDWDPSEVIFSDGADGTDDGTYIRGVFHLCGPSIAPVGAGTGYIGVVEEYSQTRNVIGEPQVASDASEALLPNLANKMEEQPTVTQIHENDGAPYNLETYAGEAGGTDSGVIYHFRFDAGSPCIIYPNIMVPCGLMEITSTAGIDIRLNMSITGKL